MEIKNRAHLPPDEYKAFEQELMRHGSLQDLLEWARRQPEDTLLPGAIADVVVQDEFTHDVIVPWRSRFIVYGTT